MLKLFAKLASALLLLGMLASPAAADLASDRAVTKAAQAAGTVGEQGDGYLGLVTGSVEPAVAEAVKNVNATRAQIYADSAAKAGTTAEAAGQATAAQLIAKLPAGEYFKPLGGGWSRK